MALHRAYSPTQTPEVQDTPGHLLFDLITPELDTYNTRLDPMGAVFHSVARPWQDCHDTESCSKTIGEMIEVVEQSAERLRVKVRFDMAKPEAAEVYRQHVEGFVKGCSVGFDPIEWHTEEGQVTCTACNAGVLSGGKTCPTCLGTGYADSFVCYDRYFVMEGSSCAVPSNPQALLVRTIEDAFQRSKKPQKLSLVARDIFVEKYGEKRLNALIKAVATWLKYGSGTQAAAKYLREHLEELHNVMDLIPPGPIFRGVAFPAQNEYENAKEGDEVIYSPLKDAEGWSASLAMAKSFATDPDWVDASRLPCALVFRADSAQAPIGLAPSSKTAKWFETAILAALPDDEKKQNRKVEREYLLFAEKIKCVLAYKGENKIQVPADSGKRTASSDARAVPLPSHVATQITPFGVRTTMKPEHRAHHRYMMGDHMRLAEDHLAAHGATEHPEHRKFHREAAMHSMQRAHGLMRMVADSMAEGHEDAPQDAAMIGGMMRKAPEGADADLATQWDACQRNCLPYVGRTFGDVARSAGAKDPDELARVMATQRTIATKYTAEVRKQAAQARATEESERLRLVTTLAASEAGLEPGLEAEIMGCDPVGYARGAAGNVRKSAPWTLDMIRRHQTEVEGAVAQVTRTAPLRDAKTGATVPGDLKQGEVDRTQVRAGFNFDADAKGAGLKPETVNRAAAFFQRSL